MLGKLRPHLTYANVASSMALFLALGGVSYAAVVLPANSVGPKHIKKGAVTSAKVKNGSLTPADLKAGLLRAGPRGGEGAQGPQGPQGPRGAAVAGPAGPSGVSGAHVVTGNLTTIPSAGGYGTATVTCPTGERVLGGNFSQQDGVPSVTIFRTAITTAGTRFEADAVSNSGTNRQFSVFAVCAA
jgi:hypothetical protein